MKINNVTWMRLSGPRDHVPGGGAGTVSKLVVQVEADDGTYGLGEAEDFLGVADAIEYVGAMIDGRDPMAVQPLISEVVYGTHPPHTEQQRRGAERTPESIRPILGMSPTATPTGPIVWAASGVEMALCDLVGKALDTPAYNLLGGAYREEARVYLDRSAPEAADDLDAWRRMAEETVAAGFDFLKFDVDYAAPSHAGDPWNRSLSTAEINRIVERIDVVRESIGPDAELAVDCHWQYNATDAVRLANALEPYDLRWFEDPCTETDLETLATVRERTDVPVCAGEMLTIDQFKEVINRNACDIAHPDVLFAGGLHGTKRIADYAEANRIPVAFHGNGACLATVAAAHVGVATRNFLGLEYHHAETDWLGEFVHRDGEPLFRNGHVTLTDAPGLGVELDEEICRERFADGEKLF